MMWTRRRPVFHAFGFGRRDWRWSSPADASAGVAGYWHIPAMTELGLLLEACGRCTLYECTGIGLLFVSPFLSFVQSLECHHAGTGEGDDRTNNETSYAVRMLCQVAPAPWFRQHCLLHLPQRRLASGSLHATRGLRRNQQSSVIWSFNVCRSDCRISRSLETECNR